MFCSIFRENYKIHLTWRYKRRWTLCDNYARLKCWKSDKNYQGIFNCQLQQFQRSNQVLGRLISSWSLSLQIAASLMLMFLFPVVLDIMIMINSALMAKQILTLNKNSKEVLRSKETNAKYEKNCDICGKIFYNSLKYAKPKYSSHPNKNNKVFNCQDPNCMETFSNKHLLNLHLKRKHSNLSIVCTHCGKSFARSDVLLKHVRNIH